MRDDTPPDAAFVEESVHAPDSRSGYRALTFDAALYEAMIDDLGVPEDEQQAYLEAMWTIIVAFVNLGFEISMEDTSAETCGQTDDVREALRGAVLECFNQQSSNESDRAAVSRLAVDSNRKEKA